MVTKTVRQNHEEVDIRGKSLRRNPPPLSARSISCGLTMFSTNEGLNRSKLILRVWCASCICGGSVQLSAGFVASSMDTCVVENVAITDQWAKRVWV